MDILLSWFLIGSLGFWVLLFLSIFIIASLVENEHGFWAFIVLASTITLLHFANANGVFSWIFNNPLLLGLYVLGYFVTGTIWVFVKWCFFLLNLKEKMKEAKTKYGEKWKEQLGTYSAYSKDNIPDPRNYKTEIMRWMTYWPFSMLATLLKDPIRWIWKFIYIKISDTLKSISVKMFSDI